MSDISQEYSDDEDIAPYDGTNAATVQQNHPNRACTVWTILLQSYDDCAGSPLILMGTMEMQQSVYSSSDTGESDEVSSVIDLDLELQANNLKAEIYLIRYNP
jgi:hypothetical protein